MSAGTRKGGNDEPIEQQLWFSEDDELDVYSDIQSATTHDYTLCGSCSYRPGHTYVVPDGLDYETEYYVILYLDSGGYWYWEESRENNWIPLTGTVRTKSAEECGAP